MDAFVISIAAYFQYRRIRAVLAKPQLLTHFQLAEGLADTISSPPPAHCNLYGNPTSQTIWWPKLVAQVIQDHPHCASLLEVVDLQGQLQTSVMCVWRNVLRLGKILTCQPTRYHREVMQMTDGGTIALDWVLPPTGTDPSTDNDRPIVILLHGIVGDSEAEYLYHYCQDLLAGGFQPVVMVTRGCGGLPLTSPSLFAGTIPFDLYETIHYLQLRSDRKLFAIGYSLGAASLLAYLALCKDRRPSGLTAALCVSPPWCFRQTALEPTLIGAFWSMMIVVPLKVHYLLHAASLRRMSAEYETISCFEVFWACNVGEFDRVVSHAYHKMDRSSITLPGGSAWIERGQRRYHSLGDYYSTTSPANMTQDMDTPTLVFSAVDDPLCPHEFCPSVDAFSAQLLVAKMGFGGHLGFPDGKYLQAAWTDKVMLDLLTRMR